MFVGVIRDGLQSRRVEGIMPRIPRLSPEDTGWWFEFDADQKSYCTRGDAHFLKLISFDDALRILACL